MSSSSPPDVEMTFEETSDTLDLDFQGILQILFSDYLLV